MFLCIVRKTKQILTIIGVALLGVMILYLVKRKPTETNPVADSQETADSIATHEQRDSQQVVQLESKESVGQADSEEDYDGESSTPAQIKPSYQRGSYRSPLDIPLELSGSFAELRPNHFHAGMDIRTGGVEGKKVYAIADGYVSRIKVSTRGYGKALYVQHKNGTTSVYGHLKQFEGEILTAVRKKQYASEQFELEWYVPPGKLPVRKGQVIALSGNTGGSGGPHLHFEIRNSRGETVNPMLYGIEVKDKISPVFLGARLYHIDNAYADSYGVYPSLQLKNGNSFTVTPGRYAIGAAWVDYLTDKLNRLGINYATLSVNGKRIHTQRLETFTFDKSRYINTHIDYWRYKKTGTRFVKFFKDDGNKLDFYKGNGIFKVKEGDTLKVEILIMDVAGHTATYAVNILGNSAAKVELHGGRRVQGKMVTHKKGGYLATTNGVLSIPPGAVYRNASFGITETPPSGRAVSPMIRVDHAHVPLHKSATMKVKIPTALKSKANKLALMSYDPKTRSSSYEGRKQSGDFIYETTKTPGIFYLAIDTVSPVIKDQSAGRRLKFRVDDLLTNIDTYRCEIDGSWVLLEYEPKLNRLFGTIPESIKPGKHSLMLRVTDGVGNQQEFTKEINL